MKIDSSLSENQKETLEEVCKEYGDVLTDVPGRTELIGHSVVVNSEIPVYNKPYIMPYAVRQKVEEEIKNMHQAGIIETFTSAYRAQ